MSEDIFWKDQTIEEARTYLNEHINEGIKCPCCNQHAKIYTRALTSAMAYGLILLYKAVGPGKEYIHIEDYFKKLDIPSSIRGDFPKLRFWGLIQPLAAKKEDGNPNSGMYKITTDGILFVQNLLRMPAAARIYNNELLGFGGEGKVIDIRQALKNKFNYEELMRR